MDCEVSATLRLEGMKKGDSDRFSKCLSPCPSAERPHWRCQLLARYLLNSGLPTSLPLKPLRLPDLNDDLFEDRFRSNAAKQKG